MNWVSISITESVAATSTATSVKEGIGLPLGGRSTWILALGFIGWKVPTITEAPSYFTQAILKLPLNCLCRPGNFSPCIVILPLGNPEMWGGVLRKSGGVKSDLAAFFGLSSILGDLAAFFWTYQHFSGLSSIFWNSPFDLGSKVEGGISGKWGG